MFRRLLPAVVLIMLLLARSFTHAQEPSPAWVGGFGSLLNNRLAPDESTLAVSTTTGLYLYDTTQLDKPPTRINHTDTVFDAIFTTDGTLLASSSYDGTVSLERVPSGETVWSVRVSEPCCVDPTPAMMSFTDDGSLLLVTTAPWSVYFVINVRSGQVQTLDTPFMAKTRSNDIAIVDLVNNTPVVRSLTVSGDTFQQHDLFALDGVNVTPDTQAFFLYDDDLFVTTGTALTIVQVSTGTVIAQLDPINGGPSLHENTFIAETQTSMTAVNLTSGARVDITKESGWYHGRDWAVYLDPNNMLMALNLATLQSTTLTPSPTAYWESEDYVLYRDSFGALELVDLATQMTLTLAGITMPQDAQDVTFTTYQQTALVSYGRNPFIAGMWDAATGSTLVEPQSYSGRGADGYVWSSTRLAVTTVQDKESGILIADLETPSLQWTPVEGYAGLRLFSARGLYYQTATGGLALLDLASGQSTPLAFEGHTTVINDVAYSPDGTRIASASDDGTVRMWDAATGQTLAVVPMETVPQRVAFAGDTLSILADGKLYTWNGSLSAGIDDFGVLNDLSVAGTTLVAVTDQNVLVLDGNLHPTLRRSFAPDSALPPTNGYTTVASDASGNYVAAAANVGSTAYPEQTIVDVWRANGAFVARLSSPDSGYGGYVKSLSFAADGSQLALSAAETTVWNMDSVPGDPAYVVVDPYASGSTFAGSNLTIGIYGIPAGSVMQYDPTGTFVQTLQRNIHVLNAGGGGDTPHEPIAGRPDGTQIAANEFPSVLTVWDAPQPAATSPQSVIAYCDKLDGAPAGLTSAAPLNVEWSWYATEIPLVLDHVSAVNYEISLDGQSVATGEAQISTIRRDSANDNHWTVYYTLNVGPLAAGEHTVTYRATWDRAISDGMSDYGPGTANPEDTGTCRFSVG